MRKCKYVSSLYLAGALSCGTAAAQTSEPPVASLLPQAIIAAARIAPGNDGTHANHFVPAFTGLPVVLALNRELALQTASFSGGPGVAGVIFRGGNSGQYAAHVTQAAQTLGAGSRRLAISYQASTFDTIDGLELRGSEMNLFGRHTCCAGQPSEGDYMQQTVSLRLHRKTVGFLFGYGLSNRFDVSVLVPFVEVAADVRVAAYILSGDPSVHNFASGEDNANYTPDLQEIGLGNRTIPGGRQPQRPGLEGSGASTARGFGDVVLRGKYQFVAATAHALAVNVDVRLPTGSRDELIGLGATQLSPALMWSMPRGRVRGRATARYTLSSGSVSSLLSGPDVDLEVPDEVGVEAGLDADILPHTTLVADVGVRRIPDVQRFTTANVPLLTTGQPSVPSVGVNALQTTGRETVNVALGAFGARVHLGGMVFLNARVIVPLGSNDSLRPGPSGIATVDYGF